MTPVQKISAPVDKWEILASLTDAADDFGLNHRTLGVLKALMSFFPERLIQARPCSAIVFPSNKTLAKRLNGMPDSTLRRHLATLVAAGIVSRHDSANKKRFARRVGTARVLAFGFDLAPLAIHADDIKASATKALIARERVAALRADVAHLRQCLVAGGDTSTLATEAARLLRRNADEHTLKAMQTEIWTRLDELDTSKLSTTNAENEQHIQYEDIELSETRSGADNMTDDISPNIVQPQSKKSAASPRFTDVTNICKEYKLFFPEPARHWNDLVQIADQITPMMGIDVSIFKQAITHMGLTTAVTSVLCILEKLKDITNPAGYLRRLTQKAMNGEFDIGLMLRIIKRGGKLSADNFRCAL
ncbi:plasmid replication protein RepC [Sulfitobacter sp. F26169L]|uniref:plasmid replication protein RepC n=1 Tax=Sulfitobacter sp. F26169L TaxID=2996015 RepID=UPI002260C1D6|nr:plasmid replication protein RepC [Sulfitobacter sp. F26169L]MCX7567407.1 plasmid replication protein RepC [Sulfitobacter sp. F26169L]